ncbi:MAG: hypothetical protein HRU09_00170 [Oligoflexales bacterium]|nr:hypothetical protein [Oligoflexales bacterium]
MRLLLRLVCRSSLLEQSGGASTQSLVKKGLKMRVGTVISAPNEYSRFGRILDGTGVGYTVEAGDLPEEVEEGDELAYKVEIWGNDSGLAFDLQED